MPLVGSAPSECHVMTESSCYIAFLIMCANFFTYFLIYLLIFLFIYLFFILLLLPLLYCCCYYLLLFWIDVICRLLYFHFLAIEIYCQYFHSKMYVWSKGIIVSAQSNSDSVIKALFSVLDTDVINALYK